MPQKTSYYSWNSNGFAKGCQLCVQGKKLVLFVTGLCPRSCFYCSISDKKYHQDVSYANERPVTCAKDVLDEAHANLAEGAGFTGGDPLCKLDRTLEYIKALKAEFGKQFHIHLYTTPESIKLDVLKALHVAGLDEIRLHPDLQDDSKWGNLKLPTEFGWDYGIEIPVIPGLFKETAKLVEFSAGKIKFLNLNELEIADNSQNKLNALGYFTKSEESYAVKGSEQMALKLMGLIEQRHNIIIHYCTAKLKDRVQLGNRIRLRAKGSARLFDVITPQGTLIRGAVYLPGLEPGSEYQQRLACVKNSDLLLDQLNQIAKGSALGEFSVDMVRFRLLCSRSKVKQKSHIIKRLGGMPALVEEYPTYDAFNLELEFL